MEFEQGLKNWASKDARLGKVMVAVGLLLMMVVFFFLKKENPIYHARIPLMILMAVFLAYGGFLAFARPKHIVNTLANYSGNAPRTLEQELNKAETDHRNYTMFKPIWLVMILLCTAAYYFLNHDFYKPLSLGLASLFAGVYSLDHFLHNNLKPYLEILKSHNKSGI